MVIMLDGDDDHKSDADFSLDQLFSAQPSQPNPIQSLLIDAQLNHPNSFCLSSVFFPIQSVKIEKTSVRLVPSPAGAIKTELIIS